MPKLRYKEHEKKEKDQSHRDRKHKNNNSNSSSSSSYRHHKRKEKPYKPPTLYEEESGWIPPDQSQKNEEQAWREHLFEAMMDDEGKDPFYSQYEHSQPTPNNDAMTDEEYRQYIVNGMFKRTHAEEIAAEEKRQAHKEKKRLEREESKAKLEKENAEHIRLLNVYNQLEQAKRRETKAADYIKKWEKLEKLTVIHSSKDIPWPVMGKEFSFECVKSFMMDSNKASSSDIKKSVRKEQTRYHPDKFITKYMTRKFEGTEKEKEKIITRINEISGWLNELWSQIT